MARNLVRWNFALQPKLAARARVLVVDSGSAARLL